MQNILVTGGAGFIGSNFIKYILKNYDYNIFNYDKLTYAGNLENLTDIEDNANYKFIKGDICELENVKKVLTDNNIDTIINFAAESHVDRSILGSREFIVTNVLGTQTLLDCFKELKLEKYLQVSTDEVYGSLPEDRKELKFTEQNPIKTNSPYSASKASADLLCNSYFHTHKLPILITRCSNNYGPYQFPEKLIPLMIAKALDGEKLPVYGDGKNVRDWLYVDDHCSAICEVLHKGKIGEVYNIGGHNEKTNMEIIRLILSAMGKDENSIKYVEDRLGHDRRYAIDNTKIQTELGWKPSVMFEEGIKLTIDWYLGHQDWMKSIERKKV